MNPGTATCNGQWTLTDFAMSRMLFESAFHLAVYVTQVICGLSGIGGPGLCYIRTSPEYIYAAVYRISTVISLGRIKQSF